MMSKFIRAFALLIYSAIIALHRIKVKFFFDKFFENDFMKNFYTSP